MRHFYKCYKKIYWHCFLRNPRENAIFQLDRLRNLYNLKGKENVGCLDVIYSRSNFSLVYKYYDVNKLTCSRYLMCSRLNFIDY